MIRYEKILFPIDMSETSVKMVPHVSSISKAVDGEIHILYVAKSSEYFIEEEEPGKRIRQKVEQFCKTHFHEISAVKISVADGETGYEIISYAEREDIDMIIMAIKGRSALGKAVFGSTAGQIVRSAGVPVVVINPGHDKFLL